MISPGLWAALGVLLAHEVLFGRQQPGVCVYARTDKPASKIIAEVPVVDASALFAIPLTAAEHLIERWMLATIVGVRQLGGDYGRFLAPSDLGRLALEHTPDLQEFVRHCVSVAQRSAA